MVFLERRRNGEQRGSAPLTRTRARDVFQNNSPLPERRRGERGFNELHLETAPCLTAVFSLRSQHLEPALLAASRPRWLHRDPHGTSRTSRALRAASSSRGDPRRAFPMSPVPGLPLLARKIPLDTPRAARTSPAKGREGTGEAEGCSRMVSLAMAEDMLDVLVPTLKIPPPEQEARAKSPLCSSAPLMRLLQRSGAVPPKAARRAPGCGVSALINVREMSGQPSVGWQAPSAAGERGALAGWRSCGSPAPGASGQQSRWERRAGAAGNRHGSIGEERWWAGASKYRVPDFCCWVPSQHHWGVPVPLSWGSAVPGGVTAPEHGSASRWTLLPRFCGGMWASPGGRPATRLLPQYRVPDFAGWMVGPRAGTTSL
ncbi:cytoglobin isoform X1 [Chroicocephalus ridibundus]|uniref:cytoglobin isoform X1 n=1 Tax=Chroicocephalus ridibundus TaxID=1192867 RepID=UPI002FDD6040